MKKTAKLTENDVMYLRSVAEKRDELRKQLKSLSNEALAQELNVHKDTVREAINGYTWKML